MCLGFRTGPAVRGAPRRARAGALPNPLWAAVSVARCHGRRQANDSRWPPVVWPSRQHRAAAQGSEGAAIHSECSSSSGIGTAGGCCRASSKGVGAGALERRGSRGGSAGQHPTRGQNPPTGGQHPPTGGQHPPASSTYRSRYTAQAALPASMHSCRRSTTPPPSSRAPSCSPRACAPSEGRPGRHSAEHSGAISTCTAWGRRGAMDSPAGCEPALVPRRT